MWRKMLHLALGGMLLAGCLGDGSEGAAAPVGGTTDRLASRLELPVQPSASRVVLTTHREYEGEMQQQLDLEVLGGTVALRSLPGGGLELVDLRIDLGDVVLDEDEMPPHGVHVTDIALRLPEPTDLEATSSPSANRLVGTGQAELLLSWSYVAVGEPAAGKVVPLGTQRVTSVALEVEVSTTDDGRALVKLHGRRHGTFVEATGLFELSDLGIELRALG